MVVDGGGADEVVEFVEVGFDGFAVVAADEAGIGEKGLAAFEVDESRRTVEIEVELLLVEQVEEGDVVLAEAQVLDGALQFGGRDKEVAEDDDKGSLADALGGIVQRGEQRGVADGLNGAHLIQNEAEMARAAFRGDFDRFFRERPKAHGIALLRGEVTERAGELFGVVEAARGAARGREAHAAARVDEEAEAEVGVGFEFLDVEAIAAAPGSPVEASRVVTRDVFAVLGEFEGRTTNGTAMLARDAAEHGLAGVEG